MAGELAIRADLVARDEVLVIEPDSYEEATQFNVGDGFTCDATRYVHLRVPEANRFTGSDPTTGFHYRPSLNYKTIVVKNYCRIEGVGVLVDRTSWPPNVELGSYAKAKQCLIKTTASNGTAGFRTTRFAVDPVFENCCAIETRASVASSGPCFYVFDTGNVKLINCTAISEDASGGSCFYSKKYLTETTAINCVAFGSATNFVSATAGEWSAATSNNASEDATAPGANSVTLSADPFVASGSGDYSIADGSALAKAGTNPLTTASDADDWKDITGKTRAYWDIGAFAAPASLAENTHLATFTTRPTDTGSSGGPNVAGTETNYPGYIDLSEAPQAFWDAVTSGGGDIRVFENQAGGLVELPAEVVSCDTSAETGELHYLLPSISASTPQEIRLYADGVSSRYDHADPFGRNAVWGDYAFVLHTESDATDSTGNLSVTEEGTPSYTAGKLGGGAALTNAGFNFSNDTSPYSLGSGYWLSWWGDFNNFSPWGNLIRFASISSGGATGAISLGRAGTTSNLYLQHDTTSVANVFSGGVSNFIASEEHYYGLRWDGSTAGLYRDATENYSRSEAVAPDMSHANFNRMFWETSSTNSDWNYVDEIRLRNGDPGANWIPTENNNQSDPSLFYTATDPNAGGGATVDTASLLAQAAAVTGTFTIEGAAGTVTVTFADLQAQSATTPASTATREITSSAALSATDIEFLNYAAREVTSASTLAAQSAAVSGSSDPMRTSEGVLTAQEADLAGTASRTVVAVGSVQAQDSGVASTVGQNQNVTGTGVLTTFPVSLMAAVAINGEVPVTGSLATTQIATSRQH
jgi:hypothetical protein